jgi:thiamine biosynthesis lipoprotein
MQLDLGGIAKGYAGDQALRTLRAAGIGAALVAASGDLAIGDAPPGTRGWRVGIGLPDRADNKLARQLLLANAAVSTSGDTEQFVELDGVRYSHILDPRTGVGLTNRVQASVIARHATATDALATTVCVLGPELGLKLVDRLGDTSALVLLNQGDELQVRPSRRLAKIAGAGQGK